METEKGVGIIMTFELEVKYKLDPSNVKKEDFKSFGDDLNHFIAEHQQVFSEIHIIKKMIE